MTTRTSTGESMHAFVVAKVAQYKGGCMRALEQLYLERDRAQAGGDWRGAQQCTHAITHCESQDWS